MSDADPPCECPCSREVSSACPLDEGSGQKSPQRPTTAEASPGSPAPGHGRACSGFAAASRACELSSPIAPELCRRGERTYVFFAIVASVALLLDVLTKAWAEVHFQALPRVGKEVTVIAGHLSFTLTYNKGGAWGLFRDFSDWIRKPFFMMVSAMAIAFLVTLYGRVRPGQRCLRWGLPLVLGGALGNLSDRIARAGVVDFIDYRGAWVAWMNRGIASVARGWTVTDHWPTFNVADIAITFGVLLMAIDMFSSRQDEAAGAGRDDSRAMHDARSPASEQPLEPR